MTRVLAFSKSGFAVWTFLVVVFVCACFLFLCVCVCGVCVVCVCVCVCVVADAGSCVGPQNRLDHLARCHR